MEKRFFRARDREFKLNRTYIMGILNVTPDSFSDGGRYTETDKAIAHAKAMINDGADVIDIGGQSTRPGHVKIMPAEEWERIKEVLFAILEHTDIAVSVDTFYPEVAEKALAAGAHIINDVSGFGAAMLAVAAKTDCGCIIMHPGGLTGKNPAGEVNAFFRQKQIEAEKAGIESSRLCFDPGIGFGKTMEENLELLARTDEAKIQGPAFLMAASRKRVIGYPCGDPPYEERGAGTIAAHTIALSLGADILRVHDVKEAVQAAKVSDAILCCRRQ